MYFSGTTVECKGFLNRWPLRDAGGPIKGRSFALNGNHEMYSLGIPYFKLILPEFGQEASYFTLFNQYWQLHGLDTAYKPFSFGQTEPTGSPLRKQYDWLREAIQQNPSKRNIVLSHNQPVSIHLPEYRAAQPLRAEAQALLGETHGNAFYAWFFGHEHRCVIYDDADPAAQFRARLIGNGSIPHHPQEETSPDHDETKAQCTRFEKINKRALTNDGNVAVSTCAILHLKGTEIRVEFVDEDEHVFHEETWLADIDVWKEQEKKRQEHQA